MPGSTAGQFTMNSSSVATSGDQSARLEPIELTAQNAARRGGDLARRPRPGIILAPFPVAKGWRKLDKSGVHHHIAVAGVPTGHRSRAPCSGRRPRPASAAALGDAAVAMSSTKCRPDIVCRPAGLHVDGVDVTGRDQSAPTRSRQQRRQTGPVTTLPPTPWPLVSHL